MKEPEPSLCLMGRRNGRTVEDEDCNMGNVVDDDKDGDADERVRVREKLKLQDRWEFEGTLRDQFQPDSPSRHQCSPSDPWFARAALGPPDRQYNNAAVRNLNLAGSSIESEIHRQSLRTAVALALLHCP